MAIYPFSESKTLDTALKTAGAAWAEYLLTLDWKIILSELEGKHLDHKSGKYFIATLSEGTHLLITRGKCLNIFLDEPNSNPKAIFQLKITKSSINIELLPE